VDVIDEGFDAVVRTGEPADSRLAARRLGTFRQYLVGAPTYFERHGVPQRPADLAIHHCLHYRFAHTGKLEVWPLRTETGAVPELPTSMSCNNIETRLCFALRGRGIAYLPEFAVREALREGHLRCVLDDFLDARRQVTLRVLWPSGGPLSPKLRVFVDFLGARVFPEAIHG
jgi:DNA-binding transcriptional LysR family regulator